MSSFWNGFEKKAGMGKFFKDVGEAAEHINDFTRGAKATEEGFRKSMPRMEEKADKALKYLKRGGGAALGIYGASKAGKLPSEIQQYKYHKANQILANKRLQEKLREEKTAK